MTAKDDVGEVSSTSKNEQPVDESKEPQDDSNLVKKEDLVEKTEEPCEKNGATTTSLDHDDDDLMILS